MFRNRVLALKYSRLLSRLILWISTVTVTLRPEYLLYWNWNLRTVQYLVRTVCAERFTMMIYTVPEVLVHALAIRVKYR